MPHPPFPNPSHPPSPSCFRLPGFSCGPVKCSTAEQLTERLWTMIHVINILCRRSGKRIEKKTIKLILIESIPGNRSGEQAEFISAIRFPSASTDIKVYLWFVFLNNVVGTLNLPLRDGIQVCTYLFSSCVVGNAVFRRNYARDCWNSKFVPYNTASALQGVVLWHTVSVSLGGEAFAHSVCRLSVVGRGLLWNWL